MSSTLKLSIFSIVGILVFCIVGIFIPPVLQLSEAFSILCCIVFSIYVISYIETNGANFLFFFLLFYYSFVSITLYFFYFSSDSLL